jgi:hypothetical protein
MVRLKIKCKDPCKIPKDRVLEIQDDLFLLSYKVEEFEQLQSRKEKDEGDEGGEDPDLDEDDLLKEDLDDINKRSSNQEDQDPNKDNGGEVTPKNNSRRGNWGQQDSNTKTMNAALRTVMRTMCGSRTGGWSLPCVMSD